MNLHSLTPLLAMAPPSAPGTQPNPTGQLVSTLGMFAIMGLMFYFLLIRPQQKRAKAQAALLDKLKPRSKVVTQSGIVGIVVTVQDKIVTLRTGDTKIEILKSSITEVTEAPAES